MSIYFGVLQGKIDVFNPEDNDSTPYLQIRVVYRIPIRMKKPFLPFCWRGNLI